MLLRLSTLVFAMVFIVGSYSDMCGDDGVGVGGMVVGVFML